jgi:chloride channel protein, CIC family
MGNRVGILSRIFQSRLLQHPLLKRYASLVHEDLGATFSRDIQKWLIIAPIIGILTGPIIAAVAYVILGVIWKVLLPAYLAHHWLIVPGLAAGFLLTGLIMQFLTPDPDEHSTEEIINSYHEHQGDIDIKPFWWKLLAAVTTVGSGGSAGLEGPSIYGGGAIGSWLWARLRRFGLEPRDRRIMLISGAAAGMGAVFRAPLTGMMFALEMPYKDDLAHEAVMPSLISSVVSYAVMVALSGTQPLFGFVGSTTFSAADLMWSALLGVCVGLVALVYDITFRRVRSFVVASRWSHTSKMLIGGVGTGLCGLLFVSIYPGKLIPIGPNYEAVSYVLSTPYPPLMLMIFAALKMIATIFSLGTGGVSAMFVPLLLSGGSLGSAFAQSVVHAQTVDLYAAVGMAAFIAAGYKTPLTAVVFVAETTGGHSFIIPSLIGSAVAYAISGEASVSGDQRVHETARIAGLADIKVKEVMQRQVVAVQSDMTLGRFMAEIAAHSRHTVFPVYEDRKPVGIVSVSALGGVPTDQWETATVGALADRGAEHVAADCDLMEALRLLAGRNANQMLLVTTPDGHLEGIVTKTDILRAFGNGERTSAAVLTSHIT